MGMTDQDKFWHKKYQELNNDDDKFVDSIAHDVYMAIIYDKRQPSLDEEEVQALMGALTRYFLAASRRKNDTYNS